MTYLYVVVCTITFDMQYWPPYSRGPLSVNTMFNLVFIRQRGNGFQHLQQSITLHHLSIHDKVFLHKQSQKLLLSKFARNGFRGSTRWISKHVFIIWFILSKASWFSSLALGWLCKPTCKQDDYTLGKESDQIQ
jgi:hypothetical protein